MQALPPAASGPLDRAVCEFTARIASMPRLTARGDAAAHARPSQPEPSNTNQVVDGAVQLMRTPVATTVDDARAAAAMPATDPTGNVEAIPAADDAESKRSTDIWLQTVGNRDLPNMRIFGTIVPDDARVVADRLDNVPAAVVERLDAAGVRSTLFSGRLTDVPGYQQLKGVQPRGWPAGVTWDDVPGVGDPDGMAMDPSREQFGRGHGSASLALHELAHVIDVVMAGSATDAAARGATISQTVSWLQGPQAEARGTGQLDEYETANPEEWFAEAFVLYTLAPESHAALARDYPATFATLEQALGQPRFD